MQCSLLVSSKGQHRVLQQVALCLLQLISVAPEWCMRLLMHVHLHKARALHSQESLPIAVVPWLGVVMRLRSKHLHGLAAQL